MSNYESNTSPKYSIKIGAWLFTFKLKLTIIALFLFIILVSLGNWQVTRSTYKKQQSLKLQQQTQQFATPLISVADPSLQHNRFMPVFFDGVFLNHFTLLLDNQMLKHKPGYRVITAVQSPYLKKLVLVDRGWVPLGSHRQQLPEIPEIYGLRQISGIINTIPTGINLAADNLPSNVTWPMVIQTIDYKFISAALQHEVFEFMLQLRSNELTNFDIPPLEFGMPSHKHLGYALQWYLFATLVVVYYLINTVKKEH